MSDLPDKEVQITLQGGKPVPSEDPVEVKKDKQKIKWCADFQFTIQIDGYSNISYSSGGAGCSFKAKSGVFPTAKTYKYTISANGVDNDPMVDVKP